MTKFEIIKISFFEKRVRAHVPKETTILLVETQSLVKLLQGDHFFLVERKNTNFF